jgi:hypothetical protein
MNFIYTRKVGYGVRKAEEFLKLTDRTFKGHDAALEGKNGADDTKALLRQILEALSKELDEK